MAFAPGQAVAVRVVHQKWQQVLCGRPTNCSCETRASIDSKEENELLYTFVFDDIACEVPRRMLDCVWQSVARGRTQRQFRRKRGRSISSTRAQEKRMTAQGKSMLVEHTGLRVELVLNTSLLQALGVSILSASIAALGSNYGEIQ